VTNAGKMAMIWVYPYAVDIRVRALEFLQVSAISSSASLDEIYNFETDVRPRRDQGGNA